MILSVIICPVLVLAEESLQQSPEMFGIEHLMEYLSLKPDDVSFRSDYTDPDSFRLEVIADLMQKPLGMIDYAASLKNAYVTGQPEIMAGILFSDLKVAGQESRGRPYQLQGTELVRQYNLYYENLALNQLLTKAATYLDVIIPKSTELSLAALTETQRRFLLNEFKEMVVIHPEEEYLSPQEIDSVEKVEEGYADLFVEFGYRIDKDPIVAAGIDCLRELLVEIRALQRLLGSGGVTAGEIMGGTGYLPPGTDRQTYLGLQSGWKIGGDGNDYYSGDYRFILDLGGTTSTIWTTIPRTRMA